MIDLLCRHALARIIHGNLHIVVCLSSLQGDLSTLWRELPGIVSQRVQHKECQGSIGFHHSIRWLHFQFDTFHLKGCPSLCNQIEEMLQGETLYLQTQFTLPQLNPVGQHAIVLTDLIREFPDIFNITAIRLLHLMDDPVDKRRDGVHQRHLRPLLKMSALTVLHPQHQG